MDITIDGDGNEGSKNDKSDDDDETIRIESGEEEGNVIPSDPWRIYETYEHYAT
nr:6772_t:CDS:2 [Entrophospora candida]